jgi:hypothetical protein
MNRLFKLFCLVTTVSLAQAQPFSKGQFSYLAKAEDSMKIQATLLVNGTSALSRFKADSAFTKLLVRTLKTPHSFHYPFDSLESISRLYAPDSSFRIFTWQLVVNENLCRQHGAVQIKTNDGTLKLFPLIDKSDITAKISDTSADNTGWIGAVYYKIIQTKNGNQSYYTLLGYDENNIRSTKKYLEVLRLNDGVPYFGGSLVSFEEDTAAKSPCSRYLMEFKKDAGARLTYDDDLKMIVAEHLQSETNEPKKKWTYIPDGDYEGFKWKNGRWVHIEKVFNQITPEGKAPVPKPIQDVQGDPLIDKLNPPPSTPAKKKGGGVKQ